MTEEPATPRRIAGIRFKGAGRVFYFDAKDIEIHTGDIVVLETAHGLSWDAS
jgi:hypothetical protein